MLRFGTDGIRGDAQEVLDVALTVGQAAGTYYQETGGRIAVTMDPRQSGEAIRGALCAGIMRAGLDVENLGVMPTPAAAHWARIRPEVAASIVVSASHNPHYHNGIKIFDAEGKKISDQTQSGLMKLINGDEPMYRSGRFGRYEDVSETSYYAYRDFLLSSVGYSLDGMRVGVDFANGAACTMAGVFRDLGAKVVLLNNRPDGVNINQNCGAASTMPDLCRAVREEGLDIGLAVDGDSDRFMAVGPDGQPVHGDVTLGGNGLASNGDVVVVTEMSNSGLEKALNAHGKRIERTPVGDRYVAQRLAELRALAPEGRPKPGFGGEQSGHLIFYDFLPTGDGMLAALQTMRNLREGGVSLKDWADTIALVPQKLVSQAVSDKMAVIGHQGVQELVAQAAQELGNNGRISLRPSGTEGLVRLMVEAPDADSRAPALMRAILRAAGV